MRKLQVGVNDLKTLRPDLLKNWDYEENNKLGIYPDKITCGSNKKVCWKCSKCGYKWKSSVYNVSKGRGCLRCSYAERGKKFSAPKHNDSLQDKFPYLVEEWDFEKNGNLLPSQLVCGSNKKVWWKCKKCGHSWTTSEIHRTAKKTGCPVCAGRKIIVGYNDLASQCQDLVKEWNYEKNRDLLPTQVTCGSQKIVWWRCSEGHEWQAKIGNRTILGRGCPICTHQKVLAGYNDLATKRPDLLKEWNYEKNGNLLPTQVNSCTSKKVWWKCSKGHEWQATVAHRTIENTGCPVCFSDNQTSFSEQAIYYFLNMIFPGEVENRYKFKDKDGFFEADIYLPKQKIVIEHDGIFWHKYKHDKDLKKESRFKKLGLKLIRIAENYENKTINNCIFYNYRKDRIKNLSWAIQELFRILNIGSLFVDAIAFQDKILELAHTNETKNNLVVTNPEVAHEWNYKMNGNLKPEMFSYGSNKNVWWICDKGHEWKMSISNRSKGEDCPYCANRKVLIGFNDLATTNPDIVKEWNYEKNKDISPTDVVSRSHIKVWWKCFKCGHEWQSRVYSRTNQSTGCPICARKIAGLKKSSPKKGQSLQDRFPDIAKEWNFRKNGNLLPSDVTFGSSKKVWWLCSKGHEWQAVIRSRTRRRHKTGCPICSNHMIVTGVNDLATLNPELAKEWDYSKNGILLPSQISCGSGKKVWWKCNTCGYEWKAMISNRSKKKNPRGCPECAKLKRKKE